MFRNNATAAMISFLKFQVFSNFQVHGNFIYSLDHLFFSQNMIFLFFHFKASGVSEFEIISLAGIIGSDTKKIIFINRIKLRLVKLKSIYKKCIKKISILS